MGKIVAVVVLGLSLVAGIDIASHAATSSDLENGIALIGREHYTDAFKLLDPLARLEDREALYQTGKLYEENKGQQAQALDEHDRLAEAASRYGPAARMFHADAAYRLGRLHLRGMGVKRDPIAAARLLRQAALADHGRAQFEFASLLAAGIGVARDEYAALTWYLIAAGRNDVSPAEPAAEAMCDRLREKLDLALEYRLRLERPEQRFKPIYTKPAHVDQYELMPRRIRAAMDRAVDFAPEGPAAERGKPDMPTSRCFSGAPES